MTYHPPNSQYRRKYRSKGFTLAELLIALAILGVIATFTIPKVLNSQQDAEKKAVAKEAASALSEAFQSYKLNVGLSSTTGSDDIMPYLNYVKRDTTSLIDDIPNMGSKDCAVKICYRLHNGAIVLSEGDTFGTPTDNLAIISFFVDPDGSYSGSTTGSGKGIKFYLHYNGKLSTEASKVAGMHNNGYTWVANGTSIDDPDWFSWD